MQRPAQQRRELSVYGSYASSRVKAFSAFVTMFSIRMWIEIQDRDLEILVCEIHHSNLCSLEHRPHYAGEKQLYFYG